MKGNENLPTIFWQDIQCFSIDNETFSPNVFIFEEEINLLELISILSAFLERENTKVLFIDKMGDYYR